MTAPGATPFVVLDLERARASPGSTLTLPTGAATTGAAARVDVEGVELRGLVEPEDVVVYLDAPRLVGGFVVVSPRDALRWKSGRRGALELEVPEAAAPDAWGTQVRFVAPVVLDAPCAAVALSAPASDDPDAERARIDAVLPPRPSGATEAFVGEGTIPLSLSPGATPVAFVDVAQAEPNPIVVLETTGDFARVVWSGWLLGWIPRPAIVHLARVGGASYHVRAPTLRQRAAIAAPPVERVACARALPILAREQGSATLAEIGEVKPLAEVTLDVAPTGTPELRPLHVRGALDDAAARVGARAADVAAAGCRRIP